MRRKSENWDCGMLYEYPPTPKKRGWGMALALALALHLKTLFRGALHSKCGKL